MIGESKTVKWIEAIIFASMPFFISFIVRFTGRFELTLENVLGSQELLFYCVIILCTMGVDIGGGFAMNPNTRRVVSVIITFLLVLCSVIFGLYCAQDDFFAKRLDPLKPGSSPLFVLPWPLSLGVAILAIILTVLVFLPQMYRWWWMKLNPEEGTVDSRSDTS